MNSWIIENLGWTLLHSLWQIAFVALILFVALRVLREFSANSRYLASIFALILSLILPIATFVYLSNTANSEVKTINQPLPNLNIEPSFQSAKPQNLPNEIPFSPSPSPNIAVTSPSPTIPFLPILVGFWLIGVLTFSIRLAGGVWTVHLYKTRKVSAVETHWQEKFEELCASLQIRQKVKFLQSQMVEMPVVIGWLKPVVLVPASAFLQISPKELETILTHELMHIQRNDYLLNLVQSLVEILFFFHPCVWWISAQIRTEREFAVDEIVSQIFETERFVYAKALANLEEARATAPILAMAADGGNLMKRIEKILNGSRKISSKNVSIWSAVFAVTLILGSTVGLYGLKNTEIKKIPSGRKIAIIISNFSEKINERKSLQKLLELQSKYKIPATWVLDSKLIDAAKQNQISSDFFSQARKNNGDFIIDVPNINATIFIDGDDEYAKLWKERAEFIEEKLMKNDYKLKYYSNSSNQIPQEIKNFLASRGLKLTRLQNFDSSLEFHFSYENDCAKSETGLFSCQPTNAEKQKEIREKYLQYMNEIFELNSNYYQAKYSKEITQVLRLGTSKLTDDSSDELFQMLKDKGYEFVPIEGAFTEEMDNVYKESMKDKNLILERFKLLKKYWRYDLVFPQNKVPIDDKKPTYQVDESVKNIQIKKNN